MQNEWILDVLADLKSFARLNGMTLLADKLDDTKRVAAAELTLIGEGHSSDERSAASTARNDFGVVGRRL